MENYKNFFHGVFFVLVFRACGWKFAQVAHISTTTFVHFLEKIKYIKNLPENVTLVNADAVGLYPSFLQQASLSALKEALEIRCVKKNPALHLVKIDEFVLKNNLFELNNKVFQQISGTAGKVFYKHKNQNHYCG